MDAHTETRYHVHGQAEPDDAREPRAWKSCMRGSEGANRKRNGNVTSSVGYPTAMMVSTRLWLAGAVSLTRDTALADRLMRQVRACAQTLQAILMCTDGGVAYPQQYPACQTLESERNCWTSTARWCVWLQVQTGKVVKHTLKKRVIQVTRQMSHGMLEQVTALLHLSQGGTMLKMAFIERFNDTICERLARLTRKCLHVARRLDALHTGMYLAKYFQGPIEGCTFNGHIWAVPLRTGGGLLYYRKDLIPTPPATWDQLTDMAIRGSGKTGHGYVWQGAMYEGLVCNFVEVLYSYGGQVLASNDPKKVVVNSPEGALSKMVSWIGTISPVNTTTFQEEDCRILWQDGQAIFMRNWAYAYNLGNDPGTSTIAGKFIIHSMAYGGSSTIGNSCLGGWQLGINAFSSHKEAAWKFIKYMIGPDVQKQIALRAALDTTLQETYDDADVRKEAPYADEIKLILQKAKPRPVSPQYSDISKAIQTHIHSALTKQETPTNALKALQSQLQVIVLR